MNSRKSDPGTSAEAGAAVNTTKYESILLDFVAKCGIDGCTSEEAANETGVGRVTLSPRFRPLAVKGCIIDSGKRRTGASGRPSIVWVLTSFAENLEVDVPEIKTRVSVELGRNEMEIIRSLASQSGLSVAAFVGNIVRSTAIAAR